VPLSLVEVMRIGDSDIDIAGVLTVFGVSGTFSIRRIEHQATQAKFR
jgi:hypothetical protein